MHYSADSARTFQKESRVFHPLVCFNCIALHLLPQTMKGKTGKAGGEIEEWSGKCFWDSLINVNFIGRLTSLRVSHRFSQLREGYRADLFSLNLASVVIHL